MDYAVEAERHRCMAEELRTMADYTPHESLRLHYPEIAEVYDRLANNEDQVARNLKIVD